VELERSFAEPLAKRVPAIEERLWSEAEGNVGRSLLWGGPDGPDVTAPFCSPPERAAR